MYTDQQPITIVIICHSCIPYNFTLFLASLKIILYVFVHIVHIYKRKGTNPNYLIIQRDIPV